MLTDRTVGEVETEIGSVLGRMSAGNLPSELEILRPFLLPPQGMQAKVSLRKRPAPGIQREDIRSDARALANWDPRTCKVEISFEEIHQPVAWDEVNRINPSGPNSERIMDLVKALDRAERDPRYREFIGIKPFRDFYLAEQSFAWAADGELCRNTINAAIERKLVNTYRVPNPKHPDYPTSAIRLNRESQEVRDILRAAVAERSVFKPIPIRGQSLSSTVLSERR